ncbi:MAG TPA: hemerythrin [Planctomycetaceae bacterium]|nr:hemerythrin [Planctomycetaceae bacterium]
MTPFVTWKAFYSVGNAAIDDQHKRILDIINDLHSAIEDGDEMDTLNSLLGRMVDYTNTHFQFEENLMKECGYPHLEEHRQLHNELRRKTAGLRSHAEIVTGSDLLSFLKTWWIDHIQEMDQQYSPYLTASVSS